METLDFERLGLGLAIGGAVAVAVGSFLVFDDVHDFGEIISTWGKTPGKHGILKGVAMPWLPPHVHHWLIGIIVLIIGAFLALLGMIFLVKAFILKT